MASYTSPSLAGYNVNPPPDDGSQTGDNEVEWGKHIEKIGDPLKDYSEAIDSATDTAFTTVDADILALDGRVDVIEADSNKYAVDTGAADAYVVTLDPVPSSYTAGLVVRFQATNANTGASTINVNALGVKDIKMPSLDDPDANIIVANGVYTIVYDGTQFQLQLPTARGVFVNDSAGGPYISSTLFTFTESSVVENTFEGVGPTGTSEPNTWTALNSVPTDADWIECFCDIDATSSSAGVGATISARKATSTVVLSTNMWVAKTRSQHTGSTASVSEAGSFIKIPVSSAEFDITWSTLGTTPTSLIVRLKLTGYGYN